MADHPMPFSVELSTEPIEGADTLLEVFRFTKLKKYELFIKETHTAYLSIILRRRCILELHILPRTYQYHPGLFHIRPGTYIYHIGLVLAWDIP